MWSGESLKRPEAGQGGKVTFLQCSADTKISYIKFNYRNARALLETFCTQSHPAQQGDHSATGSDLFHTFPVGFLCSVSLQMKKKPQLQLTDLPAWKTSTIFPICLPLELLIPVPLGTNKCQSPATLGVDLNLKWMGCRMKKIKNCHRWGTKEALQTPPTITAGKGMCSEVRTEKERDGLSQKSHNWKQTDVTGSPEDQTPQCPVSHPPYRFWKSKIKYPPVASDRQHCLIQLRDLSVYQRLESFL